MDRITILAVSCQPIFLRGLVAILKSKPWIFLIATSNVAQDTVSLVERHRPDLVLLDSGETDQGVEIIREVLRDHEGAKVVLLSGYSNVDHAVRALEAGAAGYLSSRGTEDELLAAIRHVLADGTYVSPTLATAVIAGLRAAAQRREEDRRMALTSREEQIAQHLRHGRTNREIAEHLGLREKTVKHYMTILLNKFDARNRLELALRLERPPAVNAASANSARSKLSLAPRPAITGRTQRQRMSEYRIDAA